MLKATVTKKSVKYGQEKLHIITFNLLVTDGVIEIINQDFSCEQREGEKSNQKVAEIMEKMQIVISRYEAEQVIFNSVELDTTVSNISKGLLL